ncbi:site-specific integrase [Cloacibacillus evryensis]|uniref:site-specific integrase n=1 Tax=Cloacibacillus evryensis TaxID=508460 RepID=UPI000240DEE7|nr:site-specific integrase [Cloacibacillus evryensis]EHL68424.1 hypothetical protein HMPREF1006_02447 [Synergistes sp. 3_1_syn1]
MSNYTKQTQNVYIFQNSTYHYFRQVVPPDLRPIFKRTEFRISLRTPDRMEAKRKAGRLSANLWDIFTALRKGDKKVATLSNEQVQDLVRQFIAEELEKDEATRVLRLKPQSIDPEYISASEEANDLIKSDCKEALATCNYSYIKNGADNILEANNLTADKDSMEYRTLCRELLKGQIELCKVISQRNQGVYPTTYTPYSADPLLYNSNVQISNAGKKQKVLISTAFKAYVEEKKAKGNWTPKTVLDISDKVNLFIALLGDIKLCDITQERLKAAECALFNFPKNKAKNPKYRDLTIEEIKKLDIPVEERLSRTTVVNYINQINGFLSWIKTLYELPDWISVIMSAPKGDKTEDTRASKAVFEVTDLRRIVTDEWYMKGEKRLGNSPRGALLDGARFWLPLMALFSGARLEELCQLYIADFKVIDETKCFELTSVIEDEDGTLKKVKGLKNTASKRVVPIHNELLKLGLWEYIQELKEKGHTRVFEELTFSDSAQKYSHNYSKWFNRYLHDTLHIVGSKREGMKVFYSFRHTFINYCVQHGIEDRYFERVVGHKVGGNEITYAHYAKAMSPKTLKAEVLDKIDYEIDLSCLKDNPFARVK